MRQYTERFSQRYGLFVYSITSISSIRIKLMVSVRQPSYNVYHDRHTTRTTAAIQLYGDRHTINITSKRGNHYDAIPSALYRKTLSKIT